jgi:hypothetical protein
VSPEIQTTAALAIVAVALGGLIWRWIAKRRHPGGGCSSCPTDRFKEELKKRG